MVKTIISVIMLILFVGFVYLLLTKQIKMDDIWQSAVDYVSHSYDDLAKRGDEKQATQEQPSLEEKQVAPTSTASESEILSLIENNKPPEAQTRVIKPLPKLIESDKSIKQELNNLAEQKQLWKHLRLDVVIQRFVITIDNLTKDKIPAKYLLGKPPSGKFIARRDNSLQNYISNKNHKRYESYIKLIESIDTKQVLALYQHYYPLFQEAYEDIGYKNVQFNDRLLEVIDHLLQTPEISEPIKLKHPSVFYKYTDPELEALSAGQKILLRMGNGNAMRLKTKLRELEFELSTMLLS